MCSQDSKKCEVLNECCKDNLLSILIYIDEIFNKHNIPYWLDYGSILGAVRECDIISHDDDCDIGILRQDFEKVLSLSKYFLWDRNFQVLPYFYPDFIRVDFSRINELHTDIFLWDFERKSFKNIWEDDNKKIDKIVLTRHEYLSKDDLKGRWFPVSYLFPLQKIKLRGHEFYCPNKPEEFVKFRYGLNWRIPQ